MATPDSTYEQVLAGSAALNNDTDRAVYTNAVQLPYLNLALQEMQETFEENQIPVTSKSESVLMIPAGIREITFTTPLPYRLPPDLVEITQVWERNVGGNSFTPMTRKDYLPHFQQGTQLSSFLWWAWMGNAINVLPSNAINDLKLDYIKKLFPTPIVIGDINTQIGVINSLTFLQYRTGGLCAQFIGEDKARADDLNGFALLAINRTLSTETKGRQSIAYRRRPFMASYKSNPRF